MSRADIHIDSDSVKAASKGSNRGSAAADKEINDGAMVAGSCTQKVIG